MLNANIRNYRYKNNWLGYEEIYDCPQLGPPIAPSGAHIDNHDDWAIAPPQLVLKGVANDKNHPLTLAS